MIFKGYAEANNEFLKSYDAIKPTSYIINLDASNLYEHSMIQISQLKYSIKLIQKVLIWIIFLTRIQ